MKKGLKIQIPKGMELSVGPGESDSALVNYTVSDDEKYLILTSFEGIPIDETLLVAKEKTPDEDEEEMTIEKFLAQLERK